MKTAEQIAQEMEKHKSIDKTNVMYDETWEDYMRGRKMTREEAIDLLDNLIGMVEDNHNSDYDMALKMAIKALEQEPTTKNELSLIHTEGLDEEIRCTMCTNYMKSDRGCDGSCVVNKDMYKAVMDAIEKRIQPTTKNDIRACKSCVYSKDGKCAGTEECHLCMWKISTHQLLRVI